MTTHGQTPGTPAIGLGPNTGHPAAILNDDGTGMMPDDGVPSFFDQSPTARTDLFGIDGGKTVLELEPGSRHGVPGIPRREKPPVAKQRNRPPLELVSTPRDRRPRGSRRQQRTQLGVHRG